LAKVSEVMTRGIDPVDPSATVQEAARQMAELDIGAVLIGTEEKLEGVLTDRDIIVRLVVEGRSPAEVQVREVMSAAIFGCRADDTVESAFAEMRERQVRRMPVLEEDGRPIGVVTLSDLAKVVDSPESMREALREISEPHRNRADPEAPPAEGAEAGAVREAAPDSAPPNAPSQ
jgi:CBS domain-containing protein